ncbi:hypothetical protein BGX27_003438 [Mortierella sp. AM989]|nr:hypothetical protein BGX27_003438 [Mortierella sp. AM989]
MQDLDPASLLFINRDEYTPLHLDPSIFESVGDGVAPKSFTILDPVSPLPSSPGPLENLKSLAERLNPIGQDDVQSINISASSKNGDIKSSFNGYRKMRTMGTVESWDAAWEHDLDQRVQRIDRPNIFDRLLDIEAKSPLVPNDAMLSSLAPDLSSQESAGSSCKNQWTIGSSTDSYIHGGSPPAIHPAVVPTFTKSSVEFVLELPPLTKRPRDIVDECYDRGGLGIGKLPSLREESTSNTRHAKVLKSKSEVASKDNALSNHTDSWRAVGIPLQQDTTVGGSGKGINGPIADDGTRPDKMQLTWETCTEFGPKVQPEMPFVSPYITEAGTSMFETVYQKHLDYAFKFQTAPAVIPYTYLIDCILLLLGGTPSSIFIFNQDAIEFEMDHEKIRIEGCSTSSISNLLQDMMDIGTHMRRLVSIAETCIHHPEEIGLIRIAFGRSLSSYLTFLQGTVVVLQKTAQEGKMHILELHHKTHGMGVILERLARLCQCHVEHSVEGVVSRFGFYLPPGADLLSMLYCEIMDQPDVSDPLWTALLTSILDHASKPYRDILSRWLGITPSANTGHDRSQLSQIANAKRLSDRRGTGSKNKDIHHDSGSSLISIFDCHLQQSLQGLDPFGEFFVQSKHGWSWDGSEPIILADPLDYDAEFQWSDDVTPPIFIDRSLAEQVVEAGKELQILVEFEPRHPLIAHDRKLEQTGAGLKWLYIQADIAKWHIEKSSNQILQSLATRLEGMGWISKRKASYERKRRQWRKEKLKGKQRQRTESEECSLSSSFGGSVDLMEVEEVDRVSSSFQMDAPEALELEPIMDPSLQGFFSLSSTLGETKDMSLACPDMMAFLLRPSRLSLTVPGILSSISSTFSPGIQEQTEMRLNPVRTKLEDMAPLTVLAEQSIGWPIRNRASLISTCVLSLYFHDLNLLGHLEVMERFLLMRDGQFVARVEEALFDNETGLLTRTARAGLAATVTTTPSGSKVDRRSSTTSNMSASSTRRTNRLAWPPRSGELELTLRAVLLECFQPSDVQEEWSDDEVESELDFMDVEEDKSMYSAGRGDAWKRRKLDAHDLEEMLAFAVKEYEDDSKISKDVNALEALDFLYLDYKAPRPLRLLFFTPEAFDKYTRLFTFQLRLARVDATLKQVYQQLRIRQKAFNGLSVSSTANKGRHRQSQQKQHQQQTQQRLRGWQMEMKMLHQFRFEAQQIFDGFRGYITDVALGSTWNIFIQRLEIVKARIENRIISSHSGSGEDQEFDSKAHTSDHVDPDADADAESDGQEDHNTPDELCDLAALHDYHNYILDRMLLQSLLKRKQAPILKVVYGILNCILKLSQFVDRLPEPQEYKGSESLEQRQEQEQLEYDEDSEARIAKLKSIHDKFHSLCLMLIKVLKVLDERGLGMEGSTSNLKANLGTATTTAASAKGQNIHSTNTSDVKFLQQLLLRIDMFEFNAK